MFSKSPREPSILETLHLDNTACFNEFVQKYRDVGGNNALHYAIKTGNVELCEILLETNINLCFIKNKSGKTALDLLKDPEVDNKIKHCFSSNEYNLAHTILLHDDSLNNLKILENIYSDILVSKNDDNQSLLHIAAQINDKEMLTYLLSKTKTNRLLIDSDNDDKTALHYATKLKHTDLITILLDNKSTSGNSILDKAALHHDVSTFIYLINEHKIDPFKKMQGLTQMGIELNVFTFIDHQIIKLNKKVSEYNTLKSRTPLQESNLSKSKKELADYGDMMKFLVSHKLDSGDQYLHEALTMQNPSGDLHEDAVSRIRVLLKHGADPLEVGSAQNTAFKLAAEASTLHPKYSSVVKYIASNPGTIHKAIESGDIKLCKKLMDNGADINSIIQIADGTTGEMINTKAIDLAKPELKEILKGMKEDIKDILKNKSE